MSEHVKTVKPSYIPKSLNNNATCGSYIPLLVEDKCAVIFYFR